MLYDNILIDVFNLYYRVKDKAVVSDALGYARECINKINTDIKNHLTENGKIYFYVKDSAGNIASAGIDTKIDSQGKRHTTQAYYGIIRYPQGVL
mgnify:CR=1 FL=1